MVRQLAQRWVRKAYHMELREFILNLLPPVLLNIALLPFVFVRPVQEWVGSKVFLSFMVSHLAFFPVGNTFSAHVHMTALTLLIAALWLGLSFVIVCVQVWIDQPNIIYTSLRTRGLGASYVFATFFISGYIWSRVPRLRVPMRVVMFTQTWIMTTPISHITYRNFSDLFFPLFIPAVLSIFANLMVPRTAYRTYFRCMSSALDAITGLMEISMTNFEKELVEWQKFVSQNPDNYYDAHAFEQSNNVSSSLKVLKERVSVMNRALSASLHEVTWCIIPISETNHLRTFIVDTSTWLKSGMGLSIPQVDFEDPLFDETRDAKDDEVISMAESTTSLRMTLSNPQSMSVLQMNKIEEVARSLRDLESAILDVIGLLKVLIDNSIHNFSQTYPRSSSVTFAKAIHHARLGDSEKFGNPMEILSNTEKELENAMTKCNMQLHLLLRARGFRESHENQAPTPPASVNSSSDPTKKSDEEAKSTQDQFRKPNLFCTDMYVVCQFYLSLFQLARRAKNTLNLSVPMLEKLVKRRRRSIYLPRFDFLRWIQSTSGISLFQNATTDLYLPSHYANRGQVGTTDDNNDEHSDNIAHIFENPNKKTKYKTYAQNVAHAMRTTRKNVRGNTLWSHFRYRVVSILRSSPVMNGRIFISAVLQQVKHSSHVRFALKLASGVTLFSAIGFVYPRQDQWWRQSKGPWLLIAYTWSLEATTGDSFRIAIFRIIGTILGSLFGFLTMEISRGNPWGISVMISFFSVIAILIRMRPSLVPVGALTGFTTPLVAILAYQSPRGDAPIHEALLRGYMNLLGIAAALVVNLVFWPYHARTQLMYKLSDTSTLLQNWYLTMARQMLYRGFKSSPKLQAGYIELEKSIRLHLTSCEALMRVISSELSLVPKPIKIMHRIFEHLEMIFTLFMTLRMCREQEYRTGSELAVLQVLHLRQELISSVVLDLWLVAQSMITRARLPQSLPSTKRSMEEVISATALGYHELVYYNSPNNISSQRPIYDGPFLRQEAYPKLSSTSSYGERGYASHTRTMEDTMFLLAEHSILSQIVFSLECLLQLMRFMLGELRLVN